jgi:myo-inositol 2-dehydrogenase/D-chiro-inositol 1-dehydrogenase
MLNLGLIGAGRIGKVHAACIRQHIRDAKVLGVTDPGIDRDVLKQWAAEEGIAVIYDDYKQMLGDSRIDAVLICTPATTHMQIAIDAIDAGKHIFCEKPVDEKMENIYKIIGKLRGTNLKFQVGFMQRSDHNFRALKKAITDGKIGKLHTVRLISRDPAPPPKSYIATSGGIFLDMMIHDIDLLHYLTEGEVEEVFAHGSCLVDPVFAELGDVDTAVVTIKMKNGVLATIENSRISAYGYDQRAEVFGDEGMAYIGNDIDDTICVATEKGYETERYYGFFLERYMNAYIRELSAFVDSVKNNKPVIVSIEDGLKNQKVGIALTLSCKEGRLVRLDEIG